MRHILNIARILLPQLTPSFFRTCVGLWIYVGRWTNTREKWCSSSFLLSNARRVWWIRQSVFDVVLTHLQPHHVLTSSLPIMSKDIGARYFSSLMLSSSQAARKGGLRSRKVITYNLLTLATRTKKQWGRLRTNVLMWSVLTTYPWASCRTKIFSSRVCHNPYSHWYCNVDNCMY